MTDNELVEAVLAACEQRWCCPLGLAMGGETRYPQINAARDALQIGHSEVERIARVWDTYVMANRKYAVRLAIAAGLRERLLKAVGV